MKLRPIILITLIVCLPIIALAWAAWQIAENEQLVIEQRYRTLMEDRLRDVNVTIDAYFNGLQREVNIALETDLFSATNLRELSRNEPRLNQTFVLNPSGSLIYPSPLEQLNSNEREFLLKASRMFSGQDLRTAVRKLEGGMTNTITADSEAIDAVGEKQLPDEQQINDFRSLGAPNQENVSQQQMQQQVPAAVVQLQQFKATSGWFVWYWDRGLNLIAWQRRPSGHIVGGALERARWMSELVARLPETIIPIESSQDQGGRVPTRVRLVNSSTETVYQWGTFEPDDDTEPLCEVALPHPIGAWRLQCFVPPTELTSGTGRSVYLGLFSSLLAVAVIIAAIAFVFLRDYSRDMQDAKQQVSFVNQVSHELKTPLTNIRMYAELLESDLEHVPDEQSSRPRQRLQIILSEGQRLTRLIGNVLTFARQQRNTLQLHLADVSPDQAIKRIVDRFRPSLDDQKVEICLQMKSANVQRLDCDFLEQILGNLINNVEKYAAGGNRLEVRSHQSDNLLVLDVIDDGPGIPESMQEHVFQPFSRLANDLNYAAGTGIGLSIARQLARLHGGDLILKSTKNGCWFQATLKCEESS